MYTCRCCGTLPVLYKPVLLSTVFPIPYYKNSMCHLGTGTVNSVKNATCIELWQEQRKALETYQNLHLKYKCLKVVLLIKQLIMHFRAHPHSYIYIYIPNSILVYATIFCLGITRTLKALEAASTTADIGPTVATAASKSSSFPLAMDTLPDMLAPDWLLL